MGLFGDSTSVTLDVLSDRLTPGAPVPVRVDVGRPDKRARGGRVELLYRNTYRDEERDHGDDRDTGPRQVTRVDDVVVAQQPLWDGGPAEGTVALELVLPSDAPPSVPDMVEWKVRAVVDRKLAADAVAEQPLHVAPDPAALASWAERTPRLQPGSPVSLQVAERVARPGAELTGEIVVRAGGEPVQARCLRVDLVRHRRERADIEDQRTCASAVLVEEVQVEPGQTQQAAFRLRVPGDAQPSARAQNNEQHWYVRAVLDRKLRGDWTAEVEVVLC